MPKNTRQFGAHRAVSIRAFVRPSKLRGAACSPSAGLHLLERRARKLRPRSLGRRVIELLRWADLQAPALVSADHFPGLVRLACTAWTVPLAGVSATDLPGLFDQLIGRYRAPTWLYGTLLPTAGRGHDDALWLRFFEVGTALAQGASYRDVEHLLPGQLTRRGFALLVASEVEDPLLALRIAQVRSFNGPIWLAEALAGHSRYNDLQRPLLPLLPWLCRNAIPVDLDQVLAFLRDNAVDLAGRTWASVRRMAEARHPTVVLDGGKLPRSGFAAELAACWDGWRLRELRTSLEIYVEGNVMRHCVATYIPQVRAGGTSIWSIRHSGERALTVEVRNLAKEVVQFRGRENRDATPEEMRVLHAWAATNGLAVVDASAQ
jgi:PcfJ-like protein